MIKQIPKIKARQRLFNNIDSKRIEKRSDSSRNLVGCLNHSLYGNSKDVISKAFITSNSNYKILKLFF